MKLGFNGSRSSRGSSNKGRRSFGPGHGPDRNKSFYMVASECARVKG